MAVISLAVRDFRNITAAELSLSPRLNLFTGDNGAGKTSLLEALYFLGRAQSFRTAQPSQVIRAGAAGLMVTGQLQDALGGSVPVGVERSKSATRVRFAGQPVANLAELVAHFPFQLLSPDSHKLLDSGPGLRRRYLDWGVFHVEPSFLSQWQRFRRALRQRNAALRVRASAGEISLWDRELSAAAGRLDRQRATYVAQLLPFMVRYVAEFVEVSGLSWCYHRGWPDERDYIDVLRESLEADRRQGFTRYGPQRADLTPTVDGRPAQERVSRGQQKLIVAGMMLAQASLYQVQRGEPCLFLIDDLPSELDPEHRQRVLDHLRAMQAQLFLTATEERLIAAGDWPDGKQFHVEHGRVSEVVY